MGVKIGSNQEQNSSGKNGHKVSMLTVHGDNKIKLKAKPVCKQTASAKLDQSDLHRKSTRVVKTKRKMDFIYQDSKAVMSDGSNNNASIYVDLL